MHNFLYGCLLVGCHSVVSITSTILVVVYQSKAIEASSNLSALNFLITMHSTRSTPWHSTCNVFHVATTYLVHLLFVSPCPCFFLALFVPHVGLDMLLASVHAYDIYCGELQSLTFYFGPEHIFGTAVGWAIFIIGCLVLTAHWSDKHMPMYRGWQDSWSNLWQLSLLSSLYYYMVWKKKL